MKELFVEYGLQLNEKQLNSFARYKELLLFYNAQFNLTAITDEREIYIKHFIDSLSGITLIKEGRLIDVGAGAGFPAIPLAIQNENLSVVMLEATGKKCRFLETVIDELNLKNCRVVNGRAEELSRDPVYRAAFDYCTARAVARMNTLCEYTLPFVKEGGLFLAYKGDATEETEEAKNAIHILGGALAEGKLYSLDGAVRELVAVKKVAPTPAQYPRGKGKERKQPL